VGKDIVIRYPLLDIHHSNGNWAGVGIYGRKMSSIIKIKICGITNVEDALSAVELGADALGFVFARSPRQVDPETAKSIIEALPASVAKVGVFVDEDPLRVRRIAGTCGLNTIQLHGNESPQVCEIFMPRVVKAIRLKDERSLDGLGAYVGRSAGFVLDAFSQEREGGTGLTFDWSLALKAKGAGLPVILAGGLNPRNVRAALETVHPYGVDVSSGVEGQPGRKSRPLLKTFMEEVRRYEQEVTGHES
jgi:phosphoribosylanthranilate isomerase